MRIRAGYLTRRRWSDPSPPEPTFTPPSLPIAFYVDLQVSDVDLIRGILVVQKGKGAKGRYSCASTRLGSSSATTRVDTGFTPITGSGSPALRICRSRSASARPPASARRRSAKSRTRTNRNDDDKLQLGRHRIPFDHRIRPELFEFPQA